MSVLQNYANERYKKLHNMPNSCILCRNLVVLTTSRNLFSPQIYATPEEDDILINGFAWRAQSNKSIMIAKNDYTAGLIDIRSG